MIRQELIHPMVVHFPIAMLTLAALVRVVSLFKWKPFIQEHMELSLQFLLYVGVFFYGIVLFTGDLAADVVKFQIAKPHLINQHEDFAYEALYGFIISVIIEIAGHQIWPKKIKVTKALSVMTLLISMGLMFRASHSGAMLVYEQGAAVERIQETQ
ncbi:MAG: hypothetical protein KDD61_15305 [Bdellovibrionales bacterium]|nr:hypothetical protein [Bdellovibrionales bacterium]